MPPAADPSASGGLARSARRGRRRALLIAASVYRDHDLSRLRAPGLDAAELARVLRDPRIGGYEVEVELNAPVARLQERVVDFCADRHPDDQLLIYLSCHGVLDGYGRLYYATRDAKRQKLAATAWLNERLDECRARCQVLILDCCHSGAFARGAKGDTELGLQQRFEPQGRGRVVLTASRGTEYSFEGDQVAGEGLPSVLTRAIVDGLRSGDADCDKDGLITLTELYRYVYNIVRAAEPRQNPELWTYRAEGDILIARNVRGRLTKPAQLPADLRTTLESPRPRVRAIGVAELADLLDTAEPGMALAARRALAKIAEADVQEAAEPARVALAASPGTAADQVQRVLAERTRAAHEVGGDDAAGVPGSGVRKARTGFWRARSGFRRARVPSKRAALIITAVLVAGAGLSVLAFHFDGPHGTPPLADETLQATSIAPPLAVKDYVPESVTFGPNDMTLAVATTKKDSSNGYTYLWNLATRKYTQMPMSGYKSEGMLAVAFNRNYTILAAGDSQGYIYLWSVGSVKPVLLHRPWLAGQASQGVQALAFNPSDTLLAAGESDDATYLWNVENPKNPALVHPLHDPEYQSTQPSSGCNGAEQGVDAVAFSDDGDTLATGDCNGTTYLWNVNTHASSGALPDPGSADVQGVAFDPDEKAQILAAGDYDGGTYLWDLAKPTATPQPTPTYHKLSDPGNSTIEAVAFSPDGVFIALGDANGNTYIYNVPSNSATAVAVLPCSTPENQHGVGSVAFSRDGTMIACGGHNGYTYIWHLTVQTG
jgi:hypothetical protein